MTTFQGIAVATQSLRFLARQALHASVPEALVTIDRPEEVPAATKDQPRLNIYLVQVGVDSALRNADLPTRTGNGQLVSQPQLPVTLRYLLSYFGPSPEAHLMLGAIDLVLHESPVLDGALIQQAVEQHERLQGSGLDTQVPPARVVPATLPLETLSRFWGGFFQTPYTLSTVHDVGPVVLASAGTPSASLPTLVPQPKAGGLPPALDPLPPLQYAPGATVRVGGRGVVAGQSIRVDGEWAPIVARADGELEFALPDGVLAGTRQATLGAAPLGGGEPQPVAGTPPQPLQVLPAVEIRCDGSELTVDVSPAIPAAQKVTLTLYETGGGGASAVLTATSAEQTAQLVFPMPPSAVLPAGDYLGTLTVGEASSLLEHDGERYSGPLVAIP